MEYIYELNMRVRDYEVDAEGIVNNANYLHYMEHTRHEFCREAGMTFREMLENGISPVVRRVVVDYHTPLRLGEEMSSRLLIKRQGARFIFIQDIYHLPSGVLATHGEVTIVALKDGRPTRGEELASAFAKYLKTDD